MYCSRWSILVSLVFAYFKLPESLPKSKRSKVDSVRWTSRIRKSIKQSYSMLNKGSISVIIWVTMLFIFGFTIMHAVFILYTGMAIDLGGLGYNEAQNGRIFAIIGIAGIITQGALIGPLSRRFGPAKLLPVSCLITGLGLVLFPYTKADWALAQLFLVVVVLIAVGNGILQLNCLSTDIDRQTRGCEFRRVRCPRISKFLC